MAEYVSETTEGVVLNVRAQPRSSRAGIDGIVGDAVRVRIRCAPVDGKANKELVETLAEAFGIAKSRVAFKSGETSKTKRLLLGGVTAEDVRKVLKLGLALCALCLATPVFGGALGERPIALKDGDRIAMLGDSITAQKSYTRYLETYLELCSGISGMRYMQFGWPGGTAPHGLARLPNDVLGFKPTVTTVMFGINDGKYKPYDEKIALPFKTNMLEIIRALRRGGSQALVLSPSTMDPSHGDYGPFMAALDKMSERSREASAEEGAAFADVNHLHECVEKAMIADLGKAKAKFSSDGVHDAPIGHFVMFAAALDGFKLDGTIAELTLDAKTGQATASRGHRVVAAKPGSATFESVRYPFCFPAKAKNLGEDIALALPYVDFQAHHNRFMLRVTGLAGERATVAWSDAAGKRVTKSFSRKELEAGVNLADVFRENPFVGPFYAYFEKALEKESFEGDMTCTVIPFAGYAKEATGKDMTDKFRPLWSELFAEQERRMDALRKLHVPVVHTIEVRSEK